MEEVVVRLRRELGEKLVGVYRSGSLALGGYVPGRSDVDLVAVTASGLSPERKGAIVGTLRHESLPCPARGLEFVLYAERSVRERSGAVEFELNLNTGPEMRFRVSFDARGEPPHWFVLDRVIVRESGVPLLGPPPQEVFAPIARPRVLAALADSLAWHASAPAARADDAVLNACRAWRYVEEDVLTSKVEAAAWARARGAPSVVARALDVRSGGTGEELRAEEVRRFLRDVARMLDG